VNGLEQGIFRINPFALVQRIFGIERIEPNPFDSNDCLSERIGIKACIEPINLAWFNPFNPLIRCTKLKGLLAGRGLQLGC